MTTDILLPDKLDTDAAAPLFDVLAEALGTDATLDGRGCRGIGTLCAQVLLLFVRASEGHGTTIRLLPSDGLADDLRLLGLDGLLPDQGEHA
ncbi:STAS domain-containing protein [Roseivivax isoporae]|uniref:Uncharacterized protein n=1 Tax=Roseivivax isoporae LMG 25204 TaxID=1449351 RepID=X7FDF3_9RHOB|nr:STAS domain-containing protein [Roseivivax isoporae]ETX30793.1 hypothetical protein RISW2_07275 [Roseivivax isoporae LMG 25204]